MRLKNKLEIDSTLKVGAIPTASTSNFSVLFENEGTISKRAVGDIINKNSTDFIQGISNSFPSIFNYNTSTTPSDANLVVSLKNQLAGTVFAAPTTLNGTPSFRKLIDSDLSETSLGSKANANGDNLTNIQTWRDSLGIGTLNSLTTTDKSNLVNAINEVNGSVPTNYITTNTNQTGLSGDKTTTSGNHTWNNGEHRMFLSGAVGSSTLTFDTSHYNNSDRFHWVAKTGSASGRVTVASLDHRGYLTAKQFRKEGQNDTQILLAGGGHRPVSDFALASAIPTVNDGQLTLTTGTGLSGSANFTANQSGNSSFSVGIASTHKLPTVAEWNALSTQTLSSSTSNIISGNTVQRAALTGDVTASQNSNATTIANNAVTHAKYQNIATQRILGRGAAGTGNVQELTLGSNLTLSTAGVLSATNTTYTAGTGLSLTGTVFGQTITTSGTGTFVTGITQTANGFQVNLGTPTNTTYSAGTLELLQAGTNETNRVWSPKTLADGVIRKGVNNVNPEGQPFSIEANNGRLILGEWGKFRFEEFGDQDCFFEFRYDEGPGLVVGHNHIDYEGTLAMGHLTFYGNGVYNTLSHNLNGYSRTRLPVTGTAVERVLAVGATMGGSTYYANDNGLIDLPSSDGILSYSSANGIIVTDWNSFALSEYAMSLGYGSVTSGNYATSVGGLLSTTGFGSTNQGYSNSITKALGYAVGAYNSVRATLSGVFGIGLVNRNDGAFIVGRYNSELPIVPYDTTSPHTQAVFAIGAGRDDTDRYTALTVFGDGRADYTEGYDDSNWTNNTLVTKKWVLDNAGGSSGGGVGYRNVDSSATFDLSSEYSGSVAENVYHIMTSGNVTFIGGNAVYDEGYKITIMTYSVGAYVVLDSSQGVKFIGSSGSQISYLDKPNRSVTFIYDKDYESFRVYHVSELLP